MTLAGGYEETPQHEVAICNTAPAFIHTPPADDAGDHGTEKSR